LSAALCALTLAQQAGATAVPVMLLQSTARAALLYAAGQVSADVISAPVAALVQGVTRTMLLTKLKIATAVLMAAGFTAGAGLLTHRALAGRPAAFEGPKPPATEAKRRSALDAGKLGPAGAQEKAADLLVVSGRVLDPKGKPLGGAKLYLLDNTAGQVPPPVRAASAADGRFRFTVPRAEVNLFHGMEDPWSHVTVLAVAQGYGPAWGSAGKPPAAGELTLQLVPDDVPIQGRVLDLQGKPVAGVRVRVRGLSRPKAGDLTAWLDALQANPKDAYPIGHKFLTRLHPPGFVPFFPTTATGTDGRFQLKGIGRERVVGLILEGPTIEIQQVNVRTRPGALIQTSGFKEHPYSDRPLYYGATFDHLAGPTRPIVGVVRDKDTGKPLAGVTVQSDKFANHEVSGRNLVRTTSDADGRYRLTGMPGGPGNRIKAVPGAGQPYLMSLQTVPDSPGFEPATVDFVLQRGVRIQGRVLDKATGQPVQAQVEYFVFADNPHRLEAPGFDSDRLQTKADGSFEFVGLPGRGLVCASAWEDRYLTAAGASQIKGQDKRGMYRTYPHLCVASHYHTLVEINPARDAEPLTCDVILDPGRTLTGTVLGPDGQPLPGALVCGLKSVFAMSWETEPLPTAEFTAVGLQANRPRRLVFLHQGQALAGTVLVRGDEKGPVTVRLGPWGSVTGRLVATDGLPRAGADLLFISGGEGDDPSRGSHPTRSFTTDQNGKFHIDGLVPGLRYILVVQEDGIQRVRLVRENLTVQAGERKDLGDVEARPLE
jgi:protocatechuate 3,4-dioxygenase beta subunit